ncbi:MAG: AAA family ATPase [Crenarchaeota archaeon]|nr:AAA family ATPase [Thermoproteota archaeon]
MSLLKPYWERLLRNFATKRKNVVNLRELGRHVDLFELAKISKRRPEALLRDLLSGRPVELDLSGKELDELYKKMLRIIKDDAAAKRTGKKLLFLGFPFLQVESEEVRANGPAVLLPLEGRINQKLRRVVLHRSGDPVVNELLFVFIEKKLKRGLDEKGAEELAALPPDPLEAVRAAREVIQRYVPLDGHSGPEPFGEARPGVHLRGFAVIGIFDVFSNYVLRDLNELVKKDPESLNLLLDQSFRVQHARAELLPERERYYALPYDHSQHVAISSAVKGSWAVTIFQGPPGTGKSQTIANLVSQLVAEGKSVLIVCKKKAALDVLHKRLKAARVAHVYVWDPSQDKREAFADMAQCLTGSAPPPEDALSPKIEELEQKLELVRRELTKRRACGLSLQELYTLGSKKKAILDPNALRVLTSFTYSEFERLLTKLKDVHGLRHAEAGWRRDWSEATLYDRDLALRALEELSFLDPEDLASLIKALEAEPVADGEEGLKERLGELEFAIDALRRLGAAELDADLIKYYFQKKNSLLRIFDSKFKRAKAYVERLTVPEEDLLRLAELAESYGLDGTDVDEALKLLLKVKRNIEANLEKLRLVRKYGSMPRAPEELARALEKLFYLDEVEDFGELREALEQFEGLRYYDLLKKELDSKSAELLKLLTEHDPDTLRHTYVYAWIVEIEKIPSVSKALAYMKEYENIMKEYAEAREAKLDWSKAAVEHASRADDPLLLEEVEKARKRGLKVSTFVRPRASELLEEIKVWLTSPQGASEIFPLAENLFDYVIIDEASQMEVEYALPALYRAKRAVVVGDEKQLPPRLGFGQRDGPESVLELVRGRFPSFMLKTHFRSSYEELIAFSNYAFYDGQMAYPPNVEQAGPLRYVKVDGLWRDGVNYEEAQKVVEIVREVLEEDPNTSIGIIAFNLKQKELIASMLEEEAKKDKRFAKLYEKALTLKKDGVDQGLVVENIENIQGDERDVVIFSLVHAKDEEGKLRVHFGSLNLPGGERRLNVAITRARERVYLVTSLDPEDLGSSKSAGVRLLKEYMRYAKAIHEGKHQLAKEVLASVGRSGVVKLAGPVERRLAAELGFALEVGTSRFGLPAAVGKLGVESDESVFRLTGSPLEELVRAKMIASRGWSVVRVWTRDLWLDEEGVIERLRPLRPLQS